MSYHRWEIPPSYLKDSFKGHTEDSKVTATQCRSIKYIRENHPDAELEVFYLGKNHIHSRYKISWDHVFVGLIPVGEFLEAVKNQKFKKELIRVVL